MVKTLGKIVLATMAVALMSRASGSAFASTTFTLASDPIATHHYATIDNGYTISGSLTIDTTLNTDVAITGVDLTVNGGSSPHYTLGSTIVQKLPPNAGGNNAYELNLTEPSGKFDYTLDLYIDLGSETSLKNFAGGYLFSDAHPTSTSDYSKIDEGAPGSPDWSYNLSDGYLMAPASSPNPSVPEPSSMILVGTAALAALGVSFRRRRRDGD